MAMGAQRTLGVHLLTERQGERKFSLIAVKISLCYNLL